MKRQWYQIKNETGRPAIYIYGDIGSCWWDDDAVSAAEFIEDIKPFATVPVDIHINSGGGDVFDGIAMHTALKQRSAESVCYIDALAASAASIVATGCDVIKMANGSLTMIHLASSGVWGNRIEHRQWADVLEKIDSSLCDIYSKRTGIDNDEIMTMLEETTWMKAEEAVEKGFADEIEGEILKAAAHVSTAVLAKYKNVPEELKNILATDASDIGEIISLSHPEPKAPEAAGAKAPEVEAQEKSKITVLHSGIYLQGDEN